MIRKANKNNKEIINGSNLKIGIVVSRFNSDITEKMLKGALEVLGRNKIKKGNIKIVRVPGSFEISLACQKLAKSKKYGALVAIGCVIKGETDHYHYVAGEAARGVREVMLKYSIPIGFGIITTNNLKQAKTRSIGRGNKGEEAAKAALEMTGIDW